ncbi:hypothetical protein [Flavobacterium soli]|uniref:hypothetical protein n=1 Tax=Flavobacterium soli TaxID=344881 RepID=UPI00047BEE12|nr:hypothetical protein [Flavobacterium soli]
MKKIVSIFSLFLAFSCNLSNQEYVLPSGYLFYKGGGSTNSILRNNELIIHKGVVEYSFTDNYIFFSVDSTNSKEPKKVSTKLLSYYIHDIKKDTLSRPLNYKFFNEFIKENKVDEKYNISKHQ